jgi:hypothetical protein
VTSVFGWETKNRLSSALPQRSRRQCFAALPVLFRTVQAAGFSATTQWRAARCDRRGKHQDAQLHQIASAKLAVYGKVKQCKLPNAMGQLQAHPDCPNFVQPQGRFLSDELPLIPRRVLSDSFGMRVHKILPLHEWTFSLHPRLPLPGRHQAFPSRANVE